MSSEYKERYQRLTREFRDIFSGPDKEIGNMKGIEMKVNTGDHPPIRQRPHRTNPEKQQIIRDQVDTWIKQEVCRPSHSGWANPVVLVKKKSDDWRLCIYYRALNSRTKDDNDPMSRIDNLVDTLHKSRWFSALDLTSGYLQIPMALEDVNKTEFVAPFGLYECTA